MTLIDRQFMESPFFGIRRMTWYLRNEDQAVNAKRVRRLMRLMGLMPIYRNPNTSRPAKGRQPCPYLLQGLTIDRANLVWCADITYLPKRRGFLYLVALMDWHSRRVMSWRLPNMLEAEFCDAALEGTIARVGPPEIMKTGIAVSRLCLGRPATKGRSAHLHRRQGALSGQHLLRSAVVKYECVTCTLGKPDQKPARACGPGSTSTTTGGLMPPSTDSRRT